MKTEKNSSSGSNQVVTSDQSLQQPNNRKQAPKEKAKTANSNKEKQTKKKNICILGDSMITHLKGWDISAKLKQRHSIYVRPLQVHERSKSEARQKHERVCKAMHSRR